MASLFAITTVTNSILLDNTRHGQISFTVSNTTDRGVRSHARLWTQPVAAGTWVKLIGEVERDFVGGESQQYVAQIAVSADAAPGEYLLRLDMVDVNDPDESLSEGPTIRFTVPAPVVVEHKPFPWWIIAAAVLVVLLLAGGIYGVVRAGQKPTPTPVVLVTPTPTLVPPTATPTPVPSLSTGLWIGQGTYTSQNSTFSMTLTITTVTGLNFTGTLYENTYASEVSIVGHVVGSSAESTQITFTDPSRITGQGISLNCTYNATVTSTRMNGVWYFPSNTTPNGTIALSHAIN